MVSLITDSEFQNTLELNNQVVIKFFADWCGNCKLFTPKFKRMSENEINSGITFLDINAEENENARKAASVNNLPYFAIFKNGVFVEGIATTKEETVQDLINKLK